MSIVDSLAPVPLNKPAETRLTPIRRETHREHKPDPDVDAPHNATDFPPRYSTATGIGQTGGR
jgi:hypothetical protein